MACALWAQIVHPWAIFAGEKHTLHLIVYIGLLQNEQNARAKCAQYVGQTVRILVYNVRAIH
jgi:hypothetical protein